MVPVIGSPQIGQEKQNAGLLPTLGRLTTSWIGGWAE